MSHFDCGEIIQADPSQHSNDYRCTFDRLGELIAGNAKFILSDPRKKNNKNKQLIQGI